MYTQCNMQAQRDELLQLANANLASALQQHDNEVGIKTADMEQRMQQELDRMSKAMMVCPLRFIFLTSDDLDKGGEGKGACKYHAALFPLRTGESIHLSVLISSHNSTLD